MAGTVAAAVSRVMAEGETQGEAMFRESGFRMPATCDRIVVNIKNSCVEAVLDHPDAPSQIWAFGIVRREIRLGVGAWAYLDGFDRLRRLRLHLEAPDGWQEQLHRVLDSREDESMTAELVASVAAAVAHGRDRIAPSGSSPRWSSIAGRVALVTGASRGIGSAVAQRLSAAGALIAITART